MSTIRKEQSTITVESCKDELLGEMMLFHRHLFEHSPFFCKVSSSAKKDGTWTTTPEPMNPAHRGLTRPAMRGNRFQLHYQRLSPIKSLTRRKQVKVKLGLYLVWTHIDDDGVPCIVATSTTSADVHLSAEDICQLA